MTLVRVAPEILPHPLRGKPEDPGSERVFLLNVERKSKDFGEEPIISFTGTDGSEDRHGSIINPNGWELGPYRANPVVLWGHQQLVHAIGKTIDLSRAEEKWDFDIRFALEAWGSYGGPNLAELTYRLCKDDVIRSTSISFIPKEWKDRKAETIPSFFAENVEYLRQELTEISIVNVPSNRHALKKAIADHVLSENEADLLGLGAMFRLIPALEVRTEEPKPAETPAPAIEPGARVRFADTEENRADALIAMCGPVADGTVIAVYAAEGRVDVEFLHPHYSGMFRGIAQSRLIIVEPAPADWSFEKYLETHSFMATDVTRGGVGQTRAEDDDAEPMDPPAATEAQHMATMAEDLWALAQTGMDAFDACEHEQFRYFCASLVSECLYRIDTLKYWAEAWATPAPSPVMLAAPTEAIETRAREIALKAPARGLVVIEWTRGTLNNPDSPEAIIPLDEIEIDLEALAKTTPAGELDSFINNSFGAPEFGSSPEDATPPTAADRADDASVDDEPTSYLAKILTP